LEHGGDQNRLVGVIFFVDLDHPANVTGIWPTAIYEPQKPFPHTASETSISGQSGFAQSQSRSTGAQEGRAGQAPLSDRLLAEIGR
jgi:hypothetical protein